MAWSQITLVLLAETHLEHGCSLIGLRTDGRGWMRLLGSQPDLTVADSVIWYTPFRSARLFDVVRVSIDDQPVAGRAKEDRLWRDEQLSFVRRAGRHDRGLLLSACNSAPRLLELQGGRIEPHVAQALSSSIELIPTRPTILISPHENDPANLRCRIRFVHDGHVRSLPVGNRPLRERLLDKGAGEYSLADLGLPSPANAAMVVVSVEGPFADHSYYRVGGGILPMQGEEAKQFVEPLPTPAKVSPASSSHRPPAKRPPVPCKTTANNDAPSTRWSHPPAANWGPGNPNRFTDDLRQRPSSYGEPAGGMYSDY